MTPDRPFPESAPAPAADPALAAEPAFTPGDFQREAVVYLRAILDNVPERIYFKDLQSRFLCVSKSKAYQECASSQPADMIGLTDFDIFLPEHAELAFADEQRIIKTGKPLIDAEEKLIWADGTVSWASTTKMPLYSLDGVIIGTFGVSRDITKRKHAEQNLKNTQQELLEASRLAGMAEISTGILHNIGNALNSVNTSVGLLYSRIESSRLPNLRRAVRLLEERREDLACFLTADPRGAQLPDYLLQLSAQLERDHADYLAELQQLRQSVEHINSIVAMQQAYSRAPDIAETADPVQLLDEALQISEISLSRHGIEVRREIEPVPSVKVTRHKVLVILINFIRNAKYAMDELGHDSKTMTVGVRLSSGEVLISIRDNGIGFNGEVRDKLFNFGFTTRAEGHGFGLHSSANAAREIGARIDFFSAGPGEGAEFILAIPAGEHPGV